MMAATRAMRRRLAQEGGFTIVELVISIALTCVVAAVYLSSLTSVQTRVADESLRSETLNQARLAMDELDREIRSGNLIYDPLGDNNIACGGYTCVQYQSLRVYTQTNGSTRTPTNQCVQWIVQNDQMLRRAWAPGAPGSIAGWRVIATGIVNRNAAVNGGVTKQTFFLDTSANLPPGRTIDIQLSVNATPSKYPNSPTVLLQSAISIRNYSPLLDPCTPMPAS